MPDSPQPDLRAILERGATEPAVEAQEPTSERVLLPLVLALTTFFTTTLAGFVLRGFIAGAEPVYSLWDLWANPLLLRFGLPYSLTLLSILLAHELGHYLACRYYGIRATLPYLIPGPPLPLGTFGAVIRIKSPFLDSRQLFDVGVAGPMAGMILIVPAAVAGLAWSQPLVSEPPGGFGLVVGFPLLFKGIMQLVHGGGRLESLHLVACAAWVGALVTSFNLIPAGQLDGGHIFYSIFGARRHRMLSLIGWGGLVAAGLVWWPGYLLFAIVLVFIGLRHPAPVVDGQALGAPRLALAVFALVVFVLTVVPVPLKLVDDVAAAF